MKNLDVKYFPENSNEKNKADTQSNAQFDKTNSVIQSIRNQEAKEEQNDKKEFIRKVKKHFDLIKPNNDRELITHKEFMARENTDVIYL